MMACALAMSQRKKEHYKLLNAGYDDVAHADRTKTTEDLKAVPDTLGFYEVNNFTSNPLDYQQLKSYILSCHCIKFRKGTTCTCHSTRQSRTNDFQLKVVLDSQTYEALKTVMLQNLSFLVLKLNSLFNRCLLAIK